MRGFLVINSNAIKYNYTLCHNLCLLSLGSNNDDQDFVYNFAIMLHKTALSCILNTSMMY